MDSISSLTITPATEGTALDATLAGWNWKASQMQDFNNSGNSITLHIPGNWALLVASSKEWTNYRHQADVLAIYQQLQTGWIYRRPHHSHCRG